MSKILLSTVWHTGSEYVRKELLDEGHNVIFQHCEDHLFYVLDHVKFDRMITTYRDPLKVGASWGNRYDLFKDKAIVNYWYDLWKNWAWFIRCHSPELRRASLFSGPTINSEPDHRGLHAALRDGNLDYYNCHVPTEMQDWAWKHVAESGILV